MRYHTWAQKGNEVVMSAFGRLTFYEEPVFVYEHGDRLILVCRDSTNGYSIVEYFHRSVPETDIGYEPYLDRRERAVGGSPSPSPTTGTPIFHESKNWTEFVHTGRDADAATSRLVTDENADGNDGGVFLVPIHVGVDSSLGGSASSAFFYGRWDNNGDHWFGYKFSSSFVLTDLWPGASARQILVNRLNVFHKDSTDYVVSFTIDNRDAVYTSSWQAQSTGGTIIGAPIVATGFSEHMIQEDPRRIAITISSDSPGPMIIPSLEYRAKVKRR